MAIISFRHNFIFIKTTKTAGTSIEVDLSQHVGPKDIVTPILPSIAGHHARNYQAPDGSDAFYNHMTAGLIRAGIGAEVFDGMFKFCVEREPVAKCISHFHMLRNSPLHNPEGRYQHGWDQYCQAGAFPQDIDKYSEVQDGKRVCLVDAILDYDKLETQLPALLRRLGVEGFSLRTRAKSEYSQNRLVTPEAVSAPQRDKIYEAFKDSLGLARGFEDAEF